MGQTNFETKQIVIKKDKNRKWEKLKKWMEMLERRFDEGRIINNIDNHALVKKIINKMDKLELNEEIYMEIME